MKSTEDIVVVFFSFLGDEGCLKQSLRSVRKSLPKSKIYVYDDSAHPMKHPEVLGCDYYGTQNFNRNGNLKGKEACVGINYCMRHAAHATGASWVLKLDCDTIIIKTDFLERRNTGEYNLIGWSVAANNTGTIHLSGPCYLVRASILAKVGTCIQTLRPTTYGREYCEDYVLFLCCDHIDRTKWYLPVWGLASGLVGWLYSQGVKRNDFIEGEYWLKQRANVLQDLADNPTIQVCTFGNRNLIQAPKEEWRDICAITMGESCDFLGF